VAKFDNAYNDGTDKGNLAYRDLTGLTDGFAQILAGCATLLKPGGVVVVTARPWRKHGELVDLPSAVIGAGLRAGLTPVDRCVALLAAVRDGGLVARPSFFQLQQVRRARAAGTPMHLITHEDVLVFVKGQPGIGGPSGGGVVAWSAPAARYLKPGRRSLAGQQLFAGRSPAGFRACGTRMGPCCGSGGAALRGDRDRLHSRQVASRDW